MEFAERESDSVEFEPGRGAPDVFGVPRLIDGLRSVLKERGLLAARAPSLERLREALAGRYRVVGELGRGGNAVVYLAYETALTRPVALKVLLPSRAGPDAEREQLLREARTAAKLSHRNIVPIHALEQAGEFVFFTMDYVEGETLADRVDARGPLPVGDATVILHDVAWAVGYAHARGVIHRDLKPDNILIEAESGRVMVTDFGIAQVEAQPVFDPSGYVLGTAPFLSPEQVTGKRGDKRSDVYALGVTAYYAVTGELPFYGDTTDEIFRQHLTAQVPLLEVFGENLDVTYSRAVARCLAKDPTRRFSNGEELRAWLARAPELRRGDLPLPVRAFVGRLNRLSESSRGVSVLAAGALIALIGGLVSGRWTTCAWAAGILGVLGAAAAMTLLPAARRVFRAGYTRADIIHALSVDKEGEREVRVFEHGKLTPWPARFTRPVAYGGVVIVGLATLLSFVPSLDIVVGFSVMMIGVFVAMAGAIIGQLYARRRRDLPRARWLKFWQTSAGGWVARLAALGLRRRRLSESQAPLLDGASSEGLAADYAAWPSTSWVQSIRQWLQRRGSTDSETSRWTSDG